MLSLVVLAFFGIAALQVACWVLGLVFRIFGWTLRTGLRILSLLLFPIWIVPALFLGGIALAFRIALPVAIVMFVLSLFVPEG